MKHSITLNHTDGKGSCDKGLSSRVYINQYEKEKDPTERCIKERTGYSENKHKWTKKNIDRKLCNGQ